MRASATKTRPTASSILNLIVLVVLGCLTGLFAVTKYQDWRKRSRRREEQALRSGFDTNNPPGPDNFFPTQVVERPDLVAGFEILNVQQSVGKLHPQELVMGIEIDGAFRAYSLNILNGPIREIINDELNGVPLAATWCHLCRTAQVFDRRVNGRVVTLGVSGMLWENNLVMYDEETQSLWSQMLGEAMRGELVGAKLKTIPITLTDWRTWTTKHPQTSVAYLPQSVDHHFSDSYYPDDGMTIGMVDAAAAKQWPVSLLNQVPIYNDDFGGAPVLLTFDLQTYSVSGFDRRLDNRVLEFERRADGTMFDRQTKSRWDPVTGESTDGPLKGERLKRRAIITADGAAFSVYHPGVVMAGRERVRELERKYKASTQQGGGVRTEDVAETEEGGAPEP